jgi:hypothetical protein
VTFAPGDAVAWRNCIRIDESRTHHPSFAIGMTVVRDTPEELILFRRPGYPMRRRNAELADTPAGFRHPTIRRWLDGWREEPAWSRWSVLVLKPPKAHHAISVFRDEATGEVGFWYIDLIGPVRRRPFGFDFPEHGLDVVIPPDLSAWTWKDEDELEFGVQRGIYSRAEADELYEEGRRAVERVMSTERSYFERWLDWRPDPAWPIARLPAGSEEV